MEARSSRCASGACPQVPRPPTDPAWCTPTASAALATPGRWQTPTVLDDPTLGLDDPVLDLERVEAICLRQPSIDPVPLAVPVDEERHHHERDQRAHHD